VADGRKAALAALRRREFLAVAVDETMAECDPPQPKPSGTRRPRHPPADQLRPLRRSRLIARFARRCTAEREQMLARRAATAAIETELKSTVAGLLLHSQLALSGAISLAGCRKAAHGGDLAGNLRSS